MSIIKEGVKIGYALRFPETNPVRNHRNVWYQKTKAGRLIGLDKASGGYPYAVRIFSDVKVWDRMNDALEYRDFFKEYHFDIVQVTIEVKSNW